MERIAIDKFEARVNASDKVVAIATADWCGQCKMLKLIIEKVKDNYPEILFIELDTEGDKLWDEERFKIHSVPTFLFFNKGELINNIEGYQYEEKLVELLDQFKNS